MKRKPIEHQSAGCGGCGADYNKIPDNYLFEGYGVHFYTLYVDAENYELEGITLKEVFEKYKHEFLKAELVEIHIMAPLHNEIYELCKEDGEFLLVEQGQGYV